MSGDDAFEGAIGRVKHRNVAHVELTHVLDALEEIVCCHDAHGVLDHVGAEIKESCGAHVANLEVLWSHRHVDAG